jgi:hypothetical protein
MNSRTGLKISNTVKKTSLCLQLYFLFAKKTAIYIQMELTERMCVTALKETYSEAEILDCYIHLPTYFVEVHNFSSKIVSAFGSTHVRVISRKSQ